MVPAHPDPVVAAEPLAINLATFNGAHFPQERGGAGFLNTKPARAM